MSQKIPEDSVLRRHYESAMRLQDQAGPGEPPTDSVLRRHYEAMIAAQPAASDAAAARPGPARPAVAPAPRPAAAGRAAPPPAVAPAARGDGGGVMGWLRRLFGG